MVYFYPILHTYACQNLARVTAFFKDEALLSISLAGRGQLMKMLITL